MTALLRKIETLSHLLLCVHPRWVHPVGHAGILLAVAVMPGRHRREDQRRHLPTTVFIFFIF